MALDGVEPGLRRRLAVALDRDGAYVLTSLPGGRDEIAGRRLQQAPDVVVLAEQRTVAQTAAAVRSACEDRPEVPVIVVLDGDAGNSVHRRMLAAGADGIVLEPDLETSLPVTLHAVLAGQLSVPRGLRKHVARAPLTFREKQILGLVVLGFTNRQIADKLYLAESTVKTHLSSSFAKLDARSRSEAAALILDPEEGLGTGILGISDADRPRRG